MTANITLTFSDGCTIACPPRTTIRDVLPAARSPAGFPYIAALVNNDIASLGYPVDMDAAVTLLTMADPEGWHVFQRSMAFLLAKAVKDLYPDSAFSVDYAMGDGLYCTFDEHRANGRNGGIREDQLAAVRERMRALVAQDLPIERQKLSFAEAIKRFTEAGQTDKLNLLRFRNPPRIVIHVCGGFYDLAQGPLAPSTGALGLFDLVHYPPGFVLQLPSRGNAAEVAPFKPMPQLFQIFQEHKDWGRILGVNTVGRLNEIIVNGDISDFIKIAEGLHEKKIAQIAEALSRQRDRLRFVMVAGPSSAGKTTFSKRLAIQLRVNGMRVFVISLDNYFKPLAKTPLDEQGNPDFEHIEALDLDLLGRHTQQLIRGEEICLPEFDFGTKQQRITDNRVKMGPDTLLIMEGLHAINPRITKALPPQTAFRIFVSALTQLSIDSNNRISTTDNRLIRRLVRDHKYRGHSALKTLRMWASVRRGEERWIYPFQDQADVAFNSALDYELAVLKPMAEPLLMEVKPYDREYAEARRLTMFLANFTGIPDREVPSTSMLREYIGRSGFRY